MTLTIETPRKMVALLEDYGPFKKKVEKRVISEGYDFYLLSSGGTVYHVPKGHCKNVWI